MPYRTAALFAVLFPVGLNNSLLPSPLCPLPCAADYVAALPILRLMP